MAKSHFDLRPKPPPRSGTWTVTFSTSTPSAFETSSRVLHGLCTGAQISQVPSLMSAVATGGSMGAWAMCCW